MERLNAALRYCKLKSARDRGEEVDYTKAVRIWYVINANEVINGQKRKTIESK